MASALRQAIAEGTSWVTLSLKFSVSLVGRVFTVVL